MEVFLVEYFYIFLIQTQIEGLIDAHAWILPHFLLLPSEEVLGPLEFLLILILLGVSQHSRRPQRNKMPYLVDLLQQRLFGQLLPFQFTPGHLQFHDIEIDDLLDLAVIVHGIGQHVIVEIFEELHAFIVELVEILLELLVVPSELCAQLAFFVLYPDWFQQAFKVRVFLLVHAAVIGPAPEDQVLLQSNSCAFESADYLFGE